MSPLATMFPRPLNLQWDSDEGWIVLAPFEQLWETKRVVVPKGFHTDLASIPQVFRSLLPQNGRWTYAAVVHDYCYSGATKLTRAEADSMFLAGMLGAGVPRETAELMYTAVRMFGADKWLGV